MSGNSAGVYLLAVTALAGLLAPAARSQEMSNLDRARALGMLDDVARDIRRHYYDPEFHGVDWDAKAAEAKNKIKGETSLSMALAHIAAALDTLNDSHTYFLPPRRPIRHDYGFETQMIGNQCYVTRVPPDSDAEAKGVKPGDEVLTVKGYCPNREILWKMNFRLRVLRPQSELRLALRDPEDHQRQVVLAKLVELSCFALSAHHLSVPARSKATEFLKSETLPHSPIYEFGLSASQGSKYIC